MFLLKIAVNRGYVAISENRTKRSVKVYIVNVNPNPQIESNPYREDEICGSVRSEFPPANDNISLKRFNAAHIAYLGNRIQMLASLSSSIEHAD